MQGLPFRRLTALDPAGSTFGWTQTGPTTYRMAVGPLAAQQIAFADARLTFDPMTPPPLPLVLVVNLTG